jgi:acetyltransferase-like isoleucine patch superfamily enzyme
MIARLWLHLKRKILIKKPVEYGSNFHIGLLSYITTPHSLVIGNDVYVGKFCSIQCSGTIGNGVLIASNVGIVGRRDHDIHDIGTSIRRARSVSNSPALAQHALNSITIGDDVWIGFGAVILTGIEIGRGAIIAAGSVVRDNVEEYSIVAGNPAIKMKMRFNPEEIEVHEKAIQQKRSHP